MSQLNDEESHVGASQIDNETWLADEGQVDDKSRVDASRLNDNESRGGCKPSRCESGGCELARCESARQ